MDTTFNGICHCYPSEVMPQHDEVTLSDTFYDDMGFIEDNARLKRVILGDEAVF